MIDPVIHLLLKDEHIRAVFGRLVKRKRLRISELLVNNGDPHPALSKLAEVNLVKKDSGPIPDFDIYYPTAAALEIYRQL